ncbi:Fe(2+) transporter FeoB [bioreactor metagenome]|uniref:Fe(2+) transporter FeoB n=1 Tax=bioreactor metagenome TaxID=1076179 RepID=A0A645A1Z2_9ZZZZ
MSLFYGFSTLDGGAAIGAALSSTFATPAAAYAFLVFVLLYVPCIAAMATLYREMGSLKWTAYSVLWQLGAAYLGSFLAYHIYLLIF